MFPNQFGRLLTIDDLTNDTTNPSCLSNRTGLKYGDLSNSSLIILPKTLQANRTYQFMVQMQNRRNSSQQATGYVLVKVENTRPQMIAIGCVIVTMCSPNLEYQLVNPTTQVALFSLCIGTCSLIQNIIWNVYSGQINSSQWNLFNQTNNWFFGGRTSNFTSTNQLFLNNPQVKVWKFEVVYSFPSETSISALNFVINQPPANGSCSISPLNGTTSTSFGISCPNWFDEDGIKDYTFYNSDRLMIAFSALSTLEVQLPAGELRLIVHIRDQLNCLTEYNLSTTVTVLPDTAAIDDLMNSLQSSTNNPIIQLLSSGNQNTVGQVLTSVSQEFNKMNTENLNKAAANGIPIATISVSSLGNQRSSLNGQLNQSAMIEFTKDLNSQANVREYLLSFTTNLPITTANSIKLQSSTLAQLTKSTNQLTRTTLSIAADKCFELTNVLYSLATRISYEDIQMAAVSLIQSASNIVTAVNGPLQQRTTVLDLDAARSNAFPEDYETDLESQWSKINLLDDKNSYYQKQLANRIQKQMNDVISKLTSTFQIHLNVGQQTTMNTSEVFMSLETSSRENSTVSIRSMIEPLSVYGNGQSTANTNVSTSVLLSLVDLNGNQVSIEKPIEIFIPRDANLQIPPMKLQNVTNSSLHEQLFNLHYVNITSTLGISVHLEFSPLNRSLSYLLIYKFDQIPRLNSSIHEIDGWLIIRPANLSNDGIYTFFLDNLRTQNHKSLVFGFRELNSTESSINSNERFNFTENYLLRIYTSGCYYLDANNQWQSDGLRVGPKTDHYQTHCFSTHLF